MHRTAVAIGFAVVAVGAPLAAMATVKVAVDLTHQRMHVTSSRGSYSWPISSARAGYTTPTGQFRARHLEKMHYSRKYDNSPMPHSIFFSGGYAIHGSYATRSLGRPASHGCIRLAPSNAAKLYSMVKAEGAQISISGAPSISSTRYAKTRQKARHYASGSGTRHTRRTVSRRHTAPVTYAYAYPYANGAYAAQPVSGADFFGYGY